MTSIKDSIYFRADGNSTIGLGHIVRSLALAEMLKHDFYCCFLIKEPSQPVVEMIRKVCDHKVLPGVIGVMQEYEAMKLEVTYNDILVLDGYGFDTAYQQQMKTLVGKLVVIDDEAINYANADMIINHGTASLSYDGKKTGSELLAGFQYLLLRPAFLQAARQEREVSKIEAVFICLGGADPYNITVKAVKAALACEFIKKICVVTGSAFANKRELQEVTDNNTNKNLTVYQNIEATEMIFLMRSCDLAIVPASTVSLEVCCVKAGLLIGTVAANQAGIHEQLLQKGCAVTAGDLNSVTQDHLVEQLNLLNNIQLVKEMMAKQATLVDGRSGERLLTAFKVLAEC